MKKLPHVVAITAVSLTAFCSLAMPLGGGAHPSDSVDLSLYTPPLRFNRELTTITQPALKPLTKWEKFEAEFGIYDSSPTPMLDPLVQGKHAVDVTLFTALELTSQISNILELRYSNGHFGRVASMSAPAHSTRWHDSPIHLDDVRIKFDITMAKSKPYVGVRVVFPFGS